MFHATLMISLRKIYLYTSWSPLAMFIAAYIYLETLDGWGQWATGTAVIASITLSLFYTLAGLFMLFIQFNKVAISKAFLFSILLSSSVMFWFLAKYIVLEIRVSF
jgi:hypothetical protein